MNPSATWLFDIGNTRLKFARTDRLDGHLAAQAVAHAHLDDAALDTAFAVIRNGGRAWVASVASPSITGMVEAALQRRGVHIVRVATQGFCAGVRIAYADPSRLGVDRFLAMLAAHRRSAEPKLIVGVGTALTIDLLGADGQHHGGLIAPSPTLMRESLAQRAPQLPLAGGAVTDFASDTIDALASGTLLSARALVARSLRAARRRLATTPALLATGGGADAVCDGWRVRVERVPDLVLQGLRAYADAAHTPKRR